MRQSAGRETHNETSSRASEALENGAEEGPGKTRERPVMLIIERYVCGTVGRHIRKADCDLRRIAY